MLHLVRFHCISGDVKMVEGSEFRDVIILAWQLAGNHWRWSASPYNGTTHSLLTTMAMSVKSSEFISWTRCSKTINHCYMIVNYNGRLSSNVDGHEDNYLLILCSMPLTVIVSLFS